MKEVTHSALLMTMLFTFFWQSPNKYISQSQYSLFCAYKECLDKVNEGWHPGKKVFVHPKMSWGRSK
jgi:hypothetical protein